MAKAKRKRVVESYRGKLTPAQVAEGMNAAATNAARLLDDAKLLFEAKRFPTALSLAILSIEESGKLAVLRGIATAKSSQVLLDNWSNYRDQCGSPVKRSPREPRR